jgi:hypothetical protein
MNVGVDYDMAIYTGNKVFLNSSTNVGAADEIISGRLSPGRYYLVVERMTPPPGSDPDTTPYRIKLE